MTAVQPDDDSKSWRGRGPSPALGVARLLAASPASRALSLVLVVNAVQFSGQAVVGVVTGHLDLVSDACHMGFGSAVLALSLTALLLARRPPSAAFPFGLARLEVLAAFTNGCFLLFLALSFGLEALHAALAPTADHGHHVLSRSAAVNLVLNAVAATLLLPHSRWGGDCGGGRPTAVGVAPRRPPRPGAGDPAFARAAPYASGAELTLDGVMRHVAADTVRSAGILCAAAVGRTGAAGGWAPAVVSLAIAVAIAALAWPLATASGAVLLQGYPAELAPAALPKCLHDATAGQGDNSRVVHASVWALSPGTLVGAVCITAGRGADPGVVGRRVRDAVAPRLGLASLTVDVDADGDGDDDDARGEDR